MVCGEDAGYPNVRHATSAVEVAALRARYDNAVEAASTTGTRDVLERLEAIAAASKAVWCVSASKLFRLVDSDSALVTSFAAELAAGSRLPEENDFDTTRTSVESAVSPLYHEQLQYAALSVTGVGASGYGAAAVELKEVSISQRSSTFEGPLFPFLKGLGHIVGTPVPPGHRSNWSDRALLVVAKLGPKLKPEHTDSDLASLILNPSEDRLTDCVEVHIFGPLHRLAIERIRVAKRLSKVDRVLLHGIRSKLRALEVELEIAG